MSHPSTRRILPGAITAALLLLGCSKEPAQGAQASEAAPSREASASTGADTQPATSGACSLLTLAEIRRQLPQAARAERNADVSQYGIDACGWYAGTGKASVLDVSVWDAADADDTPMENVRTLAMGIADPTRAGAQGNVRLEKIAGVGEDAVAFVEKSDPERGILTTAGMLSLRKNGRIATIASSHIADGDRPKALEQLATLGKAVAARL